MMMICRGGGVSCFWYCCGWCVCWWVRLLCWVMYRGGWWCWWCGVDCCCCCSCLGGLVGVYVCMCCVLLLMLSWGRCGWLCGWWCRLVLVVVGCMCCFVRCLI